MFGLILVFLTSLTLASTGNLNTKWDFEVRDVSRKFERESFPSGNIDAWWAAPHYNKKSGLLANNAVKEYRHMHAMVVAAFYAKRKDQREMAMEWLKGYQCENYLACRDFHRFFDAGLKANSLIMKKNTRKEAEWIRAGAAVRLADFGKEKLEPRGLCPPEAKRAAWLEQEYQLFCPRGRMPAPGGFCAGCAETKEIERRLRTDTHQDLMSSSFLDTFEHSGSNDCSGPWEVRMSCGGAGKIQYSLRCEREEKGSVSCEEKSRSH